MEEKLKNIFSCFRNSIQPFKSRHKKNKFIQTVSIISFLLSFLSFSFPFCLSTSNQRRAFSLGAVHYSNRLNCDNIYVESNAFQTASSDKEKAQKLWKSAYEINRFNSSKSLSFFQVLSDSKMSITLLNTQLEIGCLDWVNYDAEHTEGKWFGGIAVNKAVDSVWFPPYPSGKTNTVYLSEALADDFVSQIDDINSYEDLCGKKAVLGFGDEELTLVVANVIAEGDGFGGALGGLFGRFVVFDFWNSGLSEKENFEFKKLLLTKKDYSVVKQEIANYGNDSLFDMSIREAAVFETTNALNWYHEASSKSLNFVDPSGNLRLLSLIPFSLFLLLPFAFAFFKQLEIGDVLCYLFLASLIFAVFCGVFYLISFYLNAFIYYFLLFSVPSSAFYAICLAGSFLCLFVTGRKNG